MKYVFQFGRILAFCLLGEVLHALLPLPIPSSVYGLVLLLIALKTKIVKLEDVKDAGKWLIGIFLLLFLPGTVGVMEQADVLLKLWAPILVALIPMTALVFFVSGKVTDWIVSRKHSQKEADHE